jgi:hypothetical protein
MNFALIVYDIHVSIVYAVRIWQADDIVNVILPVLSHVLWIEYAYPILCLAFAFFCHKKNTSVRLDREAVAFKIF